MVHFDICVIGAGSGGLSVAAAAAQLGRRVVLIEKGRMGGECLNTGCVPSKALIAAARHAHALVAGEAFGIVPCRARIDFTRVHRHVHETIAAIAPNDSRDRFERLGVKVVPAAARFIDAATLEAGGERLTARRFVIATGSAAAVPPIPGLAEVSYLTNETLFETTELPGHLLVVGGGAIGLEMAQAFRRLGSEVTVLEAFEPLARDDPELAAIVIGRLRAEGVSLHAWTEIARFRRAGEGIAADLIQAGKVFAVEATHVLVATGRKPQIDGLDLAAAGIASTEKGITVDSRLRTSNPRIYAIGDVAGGPQFTHVAAYHAGLVIRHALFRLPVKASTAHLPWVTFTDPELAQVGLTEARARRSHGDAVSVLRWPFVENDRAQAERRADGLVKVIIGRRGRILGAGIAGAHAGELIQTWGLAIASNLKIKAMTDQIVAYPTLGEVNKRAAMSYFSGFATNPLVRFVIDVLSRFGP